MVGDGWVVIVVDVLYEVQQEYESHNKLFLFSCVCIIARGTFGCDDCSLEELAFSAQRAVVWSQY